MLGDLETKEGQSFNSSKFSETHPALAWLGRAITNYIADTNQGSARSRSSRSYYKSGTDKSATMLMILISGLMAGPAVSLYGSPTVSPVTAAL